MIRKPKIDIDLDVLDILESSWRPNSIRQRRNLFELPDEDFQFKYRFSKRFDEWIVDLLRENLSPDPRGYALSPEIQVACALRNWARHEIQDDTSDLHGVSQPVSSISNICKNVEVRTDGGQLYINCKGLPM